MKKLLAILLSILIVLSGLNMVVSSHFCGGSLAAVSFSGNEASCGMERDIKSCPEHSSLQSDCCHNKQAQLVVDGVYAPSSFDVKQLDLNAFQLVFLPLFLQLPLQTANSDKLTYTRPPSEPAVLEPSLAFLCVFRI